MENLQLKKFMENQMMFNKGIAENTDLLSKSNNGISEMVVSIGEGLDKLKEDVEKMNTKVNDLEEENNKIREELKYSKEEQKKLEESLKKVTRETDEITKTFMTNGAIKRDCEKYINSLIYKEFPKNSLKNELLHGDLTSKCKKHLSSSFNVSSFNWLKIDDEKAICSVAKSYLSPKNIHILARKRVDELHKEMDVKKGQKHITFRKARQYELVTLLLEEIGYDKDLI